MDQFYFENLSSPLSAQPAPQKLDCQFSDRETEYTEVYSWGSDRFGQLGLGQEGPGQSNHVFPKLLSYNIPISQVSCGVQHTALLASKSLLS